MNQQTIYKIFIFILFFASYGCNQTPRSKTIATPAKIDSFKRPIDEAKTKSIIGNPAVVYRSQDLGETWSEFDKGLPNEATLSGIKQYGNKIYMSTDYHGVFIAIDGENNWIELNKEQLKGLDINCIEVDANNLVVGTLKQGILFSRDGGLNWKSPNSNIKTPIRAFTRHNNKIYAGTDAGIYESVDNGETWSHTFGEIQILGFTVLNEKLYAGTQNGVLMFDGKGANWISIYSGDALHDIGNDGNYIYAMTIGQQLLKTQNDGQVWENAQNGITRPPNFYTNELKHVGTTIFSAQWIGIYRSRNNGNSWSRLEGLPDSTAFSTLEITDYGIIAGISIR